jgi:hypothetical protein
MIYIHTRINWLPTQTQQINSLPLTFHLQLTKQTIPKIKLKYVPTKPPNKNHQLSLDISTFSDTSQLRQQRSLLIRSRINQFTRKPIPPNQSS